MAYILLSNNIETGYVIVRLRPYHGLFDLYTRGGCLNHEVNPSALSMRLERSKLSLIKGGFLILGGNLSQYHD